MAEHARIQVQFQGVFQRVGFASFVAGFLQHAKDPIGPFHMIVGAIDAVPSQEDDHFFKTLLGYFLQGLGQLRMRLILEVVNHSSTPRARLLRRDARLKEPVKLLGETTQQSQLGRDLDEQRQVRVVFLGQAVGLFDDQILVLPDKGGLLVFGQPFAGLPLALRRT